MTARTQTLERANNAPTASHQQQQQQQHDKNGHPASNSSQSSNNADATIRATWTGKLLIVTGLHSDQFPTSTPGKLSRKVNGTQSNNASPSKNKTSLKRKRTNTNATQDSTGSDRSIASSPAASSTSDKEDSGSAENPNGDIVESSKGTPAVRKRRRRGQRILEQVALIPGPPSPQLPLVSEDEDKLFDGELPPPFLSHSPSPDPEDPEDEASIVYRDIYEPLTKAEAFVSALTRINPAQRRTAILYELAANTAAALRVWQDEYLEIDRLTAPHAPIPRKPATGNRQPVSPVLFEDMKEADIYDYIFDPKKVGHQNPLAQKVIRDASGRELRQRTSKGRVTADTQLVNAANALSEDDGGRRSRTRRAVNKYDGVVPEEQRQRRKRGINQVSETIETDSTSKRGRLGISGRGGRGRGRGGRGGLLGKRIREMREASAVTAVSASGEEDSASEAGMLDFDSREGSLAPTNEDGNYSQDEDDDDQLANGDDLASKRKGRPKGSKNLHVRSDKGVPKGPRAPKTDTPELASNLPPGPNASSAATTGNGISAPSSSTQEKSQTKSTGSSKQGPKSEKRSESMTAWWAKRKAAAAEAKRKEAEAAAAASEQTKRQEYEQQQKRQKSNPDLGPPGPSRGNPQTGVPGVVSASKSHRASANSPPIAATVPFATTVKYQPGQGIPPGTAFLGQSPVPGSVIYPPPYGTPASAAPNQPPAYHPLHGLGPTSQAAPPPRQQSYPPHGSPAQPPPPQALLNHHHHHHHQQQQQQQQQQSHHHHHHHHQHQHQPPPPHHHHHHGHQQHLHREPAYPSSRPPSYRDPHAPPEYEYPPRDRFDPRGPDPSRPGASIPPPPASQARHREVPPPPPGSHRPGAVYPPAPPPPPAGGQGYPPFGYALQGQGHGQDAPGQERGRADRGRGQRRF